MSAEPQPHPWAAIGSGKGGTYAWFEPGANVGKVWGRHLPHWRQPGSVYFVTFRTADSIPAEALEAWARERAEWLASHPHPHDEGTAREYHSRFTARAERYLDGCHGECPFRDGAARGIVLEVLHKLDGESYALDGYGVMPNHVHVLCAPAAGQELSEITKTWKSVTAHRLNKLRGQKGAIWQHESWDHIVRGPEHLERYRRYIRENPSRLPMVGQ